MLDGQCPNCRGTEKLRFMGKWRRIWRSGRGHCFAARWMCEACRTGWWSIQPALTTRALEAHAMTAPNGMEYRGPKCHAQEIAA